MSKQEKLFIRGLIELNIKKMNKYIDKINVYNVIGRDYQSLKYILDCHTDADSDDDPNIKMFRHFMENNIIDIDVQDKDGLTLLMRILSEKNVHYSEFIISMVIKYTKNINLQDKKGETALVKATARCFADNELDPATIAILEKGANPYLGNGENLVVFLQNPEKASVFLKYVKEIKIDVLCKAVIIGNYDVVEMLLPYVKDIKEKCPTGRTAMSYATKAKQPNAHIIELLRVSSSC